MFCYKSIDFYCGSVKIDIEEKFGGIRLRVISGCARGHKLKCLEGMNTRPTTDRIKESLFNIIAGYIPDAYILDLFAGTGALGIEALSRGAEHAVFVDQSQSASKIIRDNLTHTKLEHKAKIHTTSWNDFIDKIYANDRKFDVIFMDPPYEKGFIIPVTQRIWEKNMLSENGLLVIERDKEDEVPKVIGGFEVYREQQYGRTVLCFLRLEHA